MMLLQLLLVIGLLLVHLFAGKLRFLDGVPRSRWLSFGGGIAVTYVFLHIFPEIKEAQETISEERQIGFIDGQHAYLVALVGLILFYGLERVVKSTQKSLGNDEPRKGAGKQGETTTGMGVFWLHIASFALYNALIGYLLVHREDQEVKGLLLFFVAIALHFLVNDYGLRQDHKDTYHHLGRWVLAGAILAGWVTGILTDVGEVAVDVLFSLLAGAIILNVLKEELPEERQSRFVPFITGVTFYAILLLLV